jgi:hypothetical protein
LRDYQPSALRIGRTAGMAADGAGGDFAGIKAGSLLSGFSIQ